MDREEEAARKMSPVRLQLNEGISYWTFKKSSSDLQNRNLFVFLPPDVYLNIY